MAWREREIVEFGGLRTYFFPNLALNAVHNSQLIATRPDKANPVAAYVFGASETAPTEKETLSILVPDLEDAETVSTGLDACFALGGNFHAHYTKLNEHLLNRLNRAHDLEDPTCTQRIDKIRGILEKITAQSVAEKKFEEICNLCPLDLDFDAFVFCKLFGYYEDEKMMKEYGEELETIKGNVIEMLEKGSPGLAELMKNGPASELSRLLASPLDFYAAQRLIQLIVESYTDELTSSDTTESLTKLARLNSQLHFLVVRSLCSSTPQSRDVIKSIVSWIPAEIRRRHVFPALQMNRVEKTMEVAKRIIEIFLAGECSKLSLSKGLLEFMENPYSKNALTDILDAFRFAVRNSKALFDEDVLLVPDSKIPNAQLVETVDTALRHTTWIVHSYQRFESLENYSYPKELYYSNPAKLQMCDEGMMKAFDPNLPKGYVILVTEEPTEKKEEELIIENDNVTLLLKSVASKLETSAEKETKSASRWDCLDQEYTKERKNRGAGRALKIQNNNDQNLPTGSSRYNSPVKSYYKELDEKHQKYHKIPVIGQEQTPEKKSSSHGFKNRKQPLLQENPEANSVFTEEQWALNAPPPAPEPEAPPPKPIDPPPRKKFVKRPKIRPAPMNNFRQTGFDGAQLCDHFGIDLNVKRRLFGGIGIGEIKKFSGFV